MGSTTQYYGPDLEGDFELIEVEALQGGDIIPSHDGLYHAVEGHVVQEDGTVQVNLRRGARPGEGASYAAEFESGHQISVLT